MRNALLLLLSTFAGPALAQPKICVAEFDGTDADASHRQIEGAICGLADCVPESKLATGGKPDGSKAKALGVKYFIDGKITGKGAARALKLFVFDKYPGRPKWSKAWPMSGNTLGEKELAEVKAALSKQMSLDGGS